MIGSQCIDRIPVSPGPFTQPGYFLAGSGFSENDVLDGGSLSSPADAAVMSNGLALDLYRIAAKRMANRPQVLRFFLNYLAFGIPELLIKSAVKILMAQLEENARYVGECGDSEEAVNFLISPFEVPEDILEMASIADEQHYAATANVPNPDCQNGAGWAAEPMAVAADDDEIRSVPVMLDTDAEFCGVVENAAAEPIQPVVLQQNVELLVDNSAAATQDVEMVSFMSRVPLLPTVNFGIWAKRSKCCILRIQNAIG